MVETNSILKGCHHLTPLGGRLPLKREISTHWQAGWLFLWQDLIFGWGALAFWGINTNLALLERRFASQSAWLSPALLFNIRIWSSSCWTSAGSVSSLRWNVMEGPEHQQNGGANKLQNIFSLQKALKMSMSLKTYTQYIWEIQIGEKTIDKNNVYYFSLLLYL